MPETNLCAFDTNWLLWRAYFTSKYSKAPEKTIPATILDWICQISLNKSAKAVVACVDGSNSFRYEVFEGYKATRGDHTEGPENTPKTDAYLYLKPTQSLLAAAGIRVVQKHEFEADDLMFGFSCRFEKAFKRVYIVSRDKDMMQAVKETVYFHTPAMKDEAAVTLGIEGVKRVWGVYPKQMVDYQTLIGDKVDSIPHILTDKKARELLTEHGSLKKYFGTKAGKKFWLANQAELVRNRTLVRLVATCVDDLELEADDLLVKQRDGKGIERATGVRLPKSFHALQSYCHTKQVNLFAK